MSESLLFVERVPAYLSSLPRLSGWSRRLTLRVWKWEAGLTERSVVGSPYAGDGAGSVESPTPPTWERRPRDSYALHPNCCRLETGETHR